jgi:hypothetical protein
MSNNFRPGYLQQGSPLGNLRTNVMLSADNTVVNTSGVSYLAISSDNTTAANRTFTLTSSTLEGQILYLVFEAGSSYTCQLADSGNVKLSAAWEPLQYDSLTLMWDKTAAAWIELARNDASAVTPAYAAVYAGTFTTVGGDASEAITVTGAVATDIVAVTVKTAGATPRSIVAATAATNAINVTMSGDPSTDHVLQYVVFRAVA